MGAKDARCRLTCRTFSPVFSRKFDMKEKLQRLRQLALNNAARAVVAVGTFPVALAARANTDPFDAAAAEVTTKVGSYGASLVGIAAVSVAFYVAIKYVKKIPRAS